MARPDRLMRLMDALRRLPAPVTATRLAAETGVSPRTLYRDIATLRAGGALIDGEAGVGYRLTEDPALPPQTFTRLQIEALILAVGRLSEMGDADLTAAGDAALARIIATLPERQMRQAAHRVIRCFPQAPAPAPGVDMNLIRQACWDETSLHLTYTDLMGATTTREIWPLALGYFDRNLMLVAHCCLRGTFRSFNVARMVSVVPGGGSFAPRRVALLNDYIALRQGGAPYPRSSDSA
ncbi:helix-turn-helix transcriptional regulator [Paracoccus sp. p4-l81]|uniref:helix-turn-helix transcriptional regulator n=1 Tax=Paracoccus sp. p4-l81 TaxID=3342806 RepID=UPI0035B99B54